MSEFGFLALWLLPFAAVAIAAMGVYIHQRRGVAIKRRHLLGCSGEGRWTKGWLISTVTIFSILMLGLLRPYLGKSSVQLPSQEQQLMIILDVSASMLATDVAPDRIGAARLKIRDLIDRLQSKRQNVAFGLVVFAGDSHLFCPPTTDRAVFEHFLRSATPELISTQGSAFSAAFAEALRAQNAGALADENPTSLLLSDGEISPAEDSAEVIEDLKKSGMRLHAIGFGSESGAAVPLGNGFIAHTAEGQPVTSRRNREFLQAAANASGGIYQDATLDERDLEAIFGRPESASGRFNRPHEVVVFNELGPFAALIVFLGLIAGKLRLLPRLIPLALLTICASSVTTVADDPAADYYAERFPESVEGFYGALKDDPNNPKLIRGLASALFKAGKFAEAQAAFERFSRLAKPGRERFEGLYNLGTSALHAERFEEAIAAFDKALEIKPADVPATKNREIAQEKLREQQQQQQQQQQPQEKQKQEQSPEQRDSSKSDSDQSNEQSDNAEGEDREDEKERNGAPSPTASATPSKPEGREGSEHDKPSSSDSKKAAGADERDLPESEASPSPTGAPAASNESPSSLQPADGEKQSDESTQAAELWLRSLPDAPLLIRRPQHQAAPPGGQTW